MKTRKLISLVLAILMLVGALSIGTFAATEYRDVPSDRWSADDIAYATEKGYMNGVGDGRFNPDGTMERAMIVTVLYRMEGAPKVNFVEKFKDVPAGKYYSDAVIWASSNNITNGATATTFEPEGKLTREQMATFFARYADYCKHINTDIGADITGYSDYDSISSYAVTALSWANRYGIIKGDTETTISPKKPATREQFAAILHRFDTAEFSIDDYRVVYNEPTVHSEYTEREYPLVKDADFYVAVDGDDSADGTFEHPFATFARAKEAVRELKKTKTSEIKVAFMAGNYGELDNLTFTSEDSGSEESPITYCAYGDGDVTFSNGISIPEERFNPIEDSDKYLFSEKAYGSIYKVDLSEELDEINDSNVLFSESNVCYEARYPNKNNDGSDAYFSNCTTTVDPKSSIELQYMLPSVVSKFRTTEGMKITGFLRTGWLIDTFHVKSYDPETHIITFDFENYPINNGYSIDMFELAYEGRMDDTVFFSNLSDQLDHDGEYWFDKDTKTLYVYNPNGDYTVSDGGLFMTIGDGADNLSFVGLEFNGTSGEAIYATFAENLTFDRCTVCNVAGKTALRIHRCRNFNFINNEMYCFADNGIIIRSQGSSDIFALESYGVVVDNNYFHDFGQLEAWSEAINIEQDVGAKFTHNVFKNGSHGAIRFDATIDTVIEYNVFDNLMMTTADYGAVYTNWWFTSRSNVVRYNIFKNIRNAGAQYGVYLDGDSNGAEVYNNLFYNAGAHAVTINGGRDNQIHDNVIINTAEHDGDFLMYNIGYFTGQYLYDGTSNFDINTSSEPYNIAHHAPHEGDPNYEKWLERWPLIYKYNFDFSKIGEYECMFTTINHIKDNTIIGSDHVTGVDQAYIMFGDYKDENGNDTNKIYGIGENPGFVDPRNAKYDLRDGAKLPVIPIEKIGRY